jgi:hypothetical protein
MEQKLKKMRQEIDCDHAEMATGLIKWVVKRFRRIEFWMCLLTLMCFGCIIAIIVLFSKL